MNIDIIQIFKNFLLKKNYSDKTIESYITDLGLLNNFCDKDLIDLEEKDIRNYIQTLDAQDSSIKRKISTFKTFYKTMVKEGIIENKDNPMIRIFSPKVKKGLPKFIYYNDLIKIIDEASNSDNGLRDRLIIELLYATGVRVSELVNIKISDIDFDNNKIRVLGKGNKERIVYFGEYAKDILKQYLENKINKNNEYLFINAKNEKMSDRSVRYILDCIMKKLSINTHVTPHVLRHTFATDMLNNGCDIKIVQELLGHSSLKATEIYTHVTNEKLKEVYYKYFPRRDEDE